MAQDLKKPHIMLITWFGSGLLKPAPGTWGSLASIPVGVLIYLISGPFGLLLATAVITIIGTIAIRIFQKETNTHDLSEIVIDETVGQWIPLAIAGLNPLFILLAFILFRFFDITKIWPANVFDKMTSAWSVMADDIIAGFYAAFVLVLIMFFTGL